MGANGSPSWETRISYLLDTNICGKNFLPLSIHLFLFSIHPFLFSLVNIFSREDLLIFTNILPFYFSEYILPQAPSLFCSYLENVVVGSPLWLPTGWIISKRNIQISWWSLTLWAAPVKAATSCLCYITSSQSYRTKTMVRDWNFQMHSENLVRNQLFCLLLMWLFFSCFNLNPLLFQLHMCPSLPPSIPPFSPPLFTSSFPSPSIENFMCQGTTLGSVDTTVNKMDKILYPHGLFMLLGKRGRTVSELAR